MYNNKFELPRPNIVIGVENTSPDVLTTRETADVESILRIPLNNSFRVPVNPYNVRDTIFPSATSAQLYQYSNPLRGLDDYSRDWLRWWELWNGIELSKSNRAETRIFHIGEESVEPTRMFMAIKGAKYNWMAAAPRSEGRKGENWIVMDGGPTNVESNLRKWKNKVTTYLKTVDFVLSDLDSIVAPSLFALSALSAGGSAMLRIRRMSTAGEMGILMILATYFQSCNIVHTVSDDTVYIICQNYTKSIATGDMKTLMKFGSLSPNLISPVIGTFTETHEEFVMSVSRIFGEIYHWRYAYYHELFDILSRLRNAPDPETQGRMMIEETWPTITKNWIKETNFRTVKKMEDKK
jgi:hypothetical protein